MKKVLIIACIALIQACTVIHPVAISNNPVGAKVGKASYQRIFVPFIGLEAVISGKGDASTATAAKNGSIKQISTVDQEVKTVLIWQRVTTIVTGE